MKFSEEIIITGLDAVGDLVRWRKHLTLGEYSGSATTLTAVFGGHSAPIVDITRHQDLPLIASLDSSGQCRIWSNSKELETDPEAIDMVRH